MMILSVLEFVFYMIIGAGGLYLLLSLCFTYVVQQFPRNPVEDTPDWGTVTDTTIRSVDGRSLEVWKIDPPGKSRGIVVLAHGWGRNRGRMVGRARMFAKWGFTTVIHSARDHGNSSPKRLMNAVRFSEDINAVMEWVDEPVLLYGHSAGSVGAIITAYNNPDKVTMLFLEASYAHTKEALFNLYSWVHPAFGKLFAPMIIFWMGLFYKGAIHTYSPALLAPHIRVPVMIIHGEKDQRFPVKFAVQLKNSFTHDQVDSYFAKNSGHSDSSLDPGYPNALKTFVDQYHSPGH